MSYSAATDAGVRVNGGSPTPYNITANGVTGSGLGGGVANPGAVSCSGLVKVTFVWQPAAGQSLSTDPPPPYVVVREAASASWAGDTGSSANGLGHPQAGGQYDKISTGTDLELLSNPGPEFERVCFPAATAQITEGNPSGLDNATVQISYSAEAFPVWVETTGWQLHAGVRKLQVGQRLSAEVKYPAAMESALNTFQWIEPGHGSFADYVVVNGPTTWLADWTDYAPPATKATTLFFAGPGVYSASGWQIKIKCNATLHLDGEAFAMELEATPFKLYAPAATLESPSEAIGTERLTGPNPPYAEQLVGPSSFWLKGATHPVPPSGTAHTGMWLHWKVVEPYFLENTHSQWAYAQTVKPTFWHVQSGTHWHNRDAGLWGLDTQFPTSTTFAAVDAPQYHRDHPGYPSIQSATWLYFSGDFKVWAMYQPTGPAADVRWVPVRLRGWECRRFARWTESQQGGYAVYEYLSPVVAKFKNVPILGEMPFPEYTFRHVAGSGWLPGPP